MPAIARIDVGFYLIPLPMALSDSTHGIMTGFEIVTIRVTDAEGATGVGYTFTTGRGGAAIAEIARRDIADLVLGEDGDRIEALWEKVWWATHYGGRGGAQVLALSALDIALWDLKSKRAGMALWRYLGGHQPGVSCYAGGIDLGLDADALLAQTDENLARGFRAIKMKVGRDNLAEDVTKVAAMRAHLGEGFPLMLDANMKYSVDQAIAAARAFAPYQPTWFEEPIIPDDVAGHARVLQAGGVPLAAGENLRTLWDFRHLIASGGVSFPEPDVTNCGGVTAFMKIAALAESFNLPLTSHGAHDITVHLLCAAPNGRFLEAHGFGLDAYIAHPLTIENGLAMAPERPGHGMEFDWEKLESVARC